jgi:hypothetical protein
MHAWHLNHNMNSQLHYNLFLHTFLCSAYRMEPAALEALLLRDKDLKVTANGKSLVYVCSRGRSPQAAANAGAAAVSNTTTSGSTGDRKRHLLNDISTAHLHMEEADHDHHHDHSHGHLHGSASRRLQQVSPAGFDNGGWWPTNANYTATGVPVLHR